MADKSKIIYGVPVNVEEIKINKKYYDVNTGEPYYRDLVDEYKYYIEGTDIEIDYSTYRDNELLHDPCDLDRGIILGIFIIQVSVYNSTEIIPSIKKLQKDKMKILLESLKCDKKPKLYLQHVLG